MEKNRLRLYFIVLLLFYIISQFVFVPAAEAQGSRGQPYLMGAVRASGPTSWNWSLSPIFNDSSYAGNDWWYYSNTFTLGSKVANIYKFWYFRQDFWDWWSGSWGYSSGWWSYSDYWSQYQGYTYNYTYYSYTYSYLTWRLGSYPGGQDVIGPSTVYVGYYYYYWYYYTYYWYRYRIYYYWWYWYYWWWWGWWYWWYYYYWGWSPWYFYTYWWYYNYSYWYQYNYSTGSWLYPSTSAFIINSSRTFADGVYYHQIRNQRDNRRSPEKRYYIDSRAPYYTITSPANNTVVCSGNSISFNFFCSDYSNGTGLNRNNTPSITSSRSYLTVINASNAEVLRSSVSEGSNTFNQPFSPAGTYRWKIHLEDNIGWVTDSPWYTFTVDNVAPPVMNMTSPVDNQWVNTRTVTFNWQASVDAGTGTKGYYIKIMKLDGTPYDSNFSGNGKFLTCSTVGLPATFSYNIADGDYKWELFAEDKCGQRSALFQVAGDPAAPRKKFRVDATAPTINVIKPDMAPTWYNEYNNNATALVKFKADYADNVSVNEHKLEVFKPGAGSPTYTDGIFLPAGSNSFPSPNVTLDKDHRCDSPIVNGTWIARFWAKDSAGNPVQVDRQFQVDITRPVPGVLWKVDTYDVTGQPWNTTYPIVNNSSPTLTWTAASDNAISNPQSGIANYYLYVWDGSGNQLIYQKPLSNSTLSYQLTGLSSGVYYWEVGVKDVAGNAEVRYRTQDDNYLNKRRFIVDLSPPTAKQYNPPTPNNGSGTGGPWVISPTPNSNSATPVFAGEVQDDYGVYNYKITLWDKPGTTALGSKDSTTFVAPPLTATALWYKIDPGITIMSRPDGSYKWSIEVWDRCMPTGNKYTSPKLDFNIDTRPPKLPVPAAPLQKMYFPMGRTGPDGKPLNGWLPAPNRTNPTFQFCAASDDLGASGFSGIKAYKIRLWWDPNFTTPASTYPEAPFLGKAYIDYDLPASALSVGYNGLISFDLPAADALKNGRYWWDVWVCDNAGNWRWYEKTSIGNSTITEIAADKVMPTTGPNWFCVDCIPPDGNVLISEIDDIWIKEFKPDFKWKAGRDSTPGSGVKSYELHVWNDGFASLFTCEILFAAPYNAAFGTALTYNPFTALGKAQLVNGRYYWDIKIIDVAGNYTWYKCALKNADPALISAHDKFRVDGLPPNVGIIKYPKSDQWISQLGTRTINEDGDAVYSPRKKPDLVFTASEDLQSGILKYHIVLKDSRTPKQIIGETTLTAANAPDLFAANYGAEYTYTPPWGISPWPTDLKDGRYYWDVDVTDKTGVNVNYYSKPLPPGAGVIPTVPVNAADLAASQNDANFTKFRLDTLPPIVMTPEGSFAIDEVHPGYGNLLAPKYGYITTVSVNLVNFKFSKAIDDIGLGYNGARLDCDTDAVGAGSGVDGYSFAIADTRDMLKERVTANIWESGYVISTSAVVISYFTSIPPAKDEQLNALTSASVYWTIFVRDIAGNEVQYVDRKIRIRHIPPNAGHLIAPPNGKVTTNRKPKFEWTLQ